MIIELDDEELQFISVKELEGMLDCDLITVQIPLPSINFANSYIDIIWDYLDASFVIESLSNNFLVVNLDKVWDVKYYPVYHLKIEVFDKKKLSLELKELIWSFQSPEEQYLEIEYINYREKINEYEGEFTGLKLRYPEVIDDYLINLVNGAYYEMEYETIREQLSHFPERYYGFFFGAKYNTCEEKVLFSSQSWIVPKSLTLEKVFSDHNYDGQISVLPAHLLMIDQKTVAISEIGVVEIPMGQVLQAIACYEDYSNPRDEYRQKLSLDGSFFESSPKERDLEESFPSVFNTQSELYKVYTSEFSDFCIVSTKEVNIVLFDVSQIRNRESQKFLDASMQLLSNLEDEIVTDSKVCIDWNIFDDELFEQLCYDIIYHNSKFNRNTIRKMGKSRSRDGGRDIVVYTKSISGDKPKKYVFQCKLSGREKSINTSNVGSVSDVIEQYCAEGYGLMCNCYIDSTLFDRLDGISNRRGVDIETWSGFEVERFLSRRPLIKQRYEIN